MYVIVLIAPKSSMTHSLKKNINSQNSFCACVLRRAGQRRFQCLYEDALHSGSISTSSAIPINQKTGDPRGNPGVVRSSAVADISERRDGRPEGKPEPEEQVSLMGGSRFRA